MFRYASVNALSGNEQSRRDDMESLGYMLVYLVKGQLPWQGLKGENRRQKYQRICDCKRMTSTEELCQVRVGFRGFAVLMSLKNAHFHSLEQYYILLCTTAIIAIVSSLVYLMLYFHRSQ